MPRTEAPSQATELEQLRFLTTLVDQADIGLVVVDVNLRIKIWNRWIEQFSAISAERAIATRLSDLFPEILNTRFYKALRGALDFGFPALISNVFNRTPLPLYRPDSAISKSGVRERIQQQLKVMPFRIDRGRRYCLLQIIDVTASAPREKVLETQVSKRKESEALLKINEHALLRSNAELESFACIASHDLQEPLRKIRTFGELLVSECADSLNADGRDFIARMQNATGRMQTLINDLLTLSKVSSSAQEPQPIDLSKTVNGVLEDLEIRIKETEATIDVDCLPTIMADPLLFRQMFQNLIGNALKFRKPGIKPHVKIHADIVAENESRVPVCRIQVRDNGIGFDPKCSKRIFQMFERLHRRDEYKGSGIGLSICRKIVERYGGAISAEGQPGIGATFTIEVSGAVPESPESNFSGNRVEPDLPIIDCTGNFTSMKISTNVSIVKKIIDPVSNNREQPFIFRYSNAK